MGKKKILGEIVISEYKILRKIRKAWKRNPVTIISDSDKKPKTRKEKHKQRFEDFEEGV